ncbi:MAG: hypothetical protein ACRYFX_00180 [Janthinobacterium lividum]
MGLDTVELANSFERYFGLELPDPVVEQIATVGDVATWFGQQLGVAGQRQSAVRAAVAAQLQTVLPHPETTLLRQLLPDAPAVQALRLGLRQQHSLELPRLAASPAAGAPPSLWERLWGRPLFAPPAWPTQTMAELIDWLVATNYQKLLVPPLTSQYEVEQAVIGITSESASIPVEEIQLSSSFTSDLGMD